MQLQGRIETIEFGQVRLIREKDRHSVFGYGIIFNGRIFWGWAERLQKKRMKLLSRIRVSLRVLGELSYQDIAKLFGKTESWARVTFHRAKLKIIEQVKEESYE